MGEVFNGWRRKIGVVTLVLAVVFAAEWVRGSHVYDVVKFTIGNQQHVLMGIDSVVIWEFWSRDGAAPEWGWKTLPPTKSLLTGVKIAIVGGSAPADFHFHVFAWTVAIPLTLISAYFLLTNPRKLNPKILDKTAMRAETRQVHYYSIAIPLTFTSALLIFPKSRASTSKKTPEPSANRRA